MKLRTLLASVIGLLTCCHLVSAQRLSNGGLSFQTYEKSADTKTDYNVLLGDLALEFNYIGGLLYDDNSNRSPDVSYDRFGEENIDDDDAFQTTNGIGTRLFYPITPGLTFDASFFVNYVWTINGDGNDGVFLSGAELLGDTAASFDLTLVANDQHTIILSDHFGVFDDVIDYDFGRAHEDLTYFENTLALQWEYAISPLMTFGLRGERVNAFSKESDLDFVDHIDHTITTKLAFQLQPDLTVAPFLTYTETDFDDNLVYFEFGPTSSRFAGNNDARTYSGGITADYLLSPAIRLIGGLGWTYVDADDNRNAKRDDKNEGITTYIGLQQDVTELFKHSLSFEIVREAALAVEVNTREVYSTAYEFDWQFAPEFILTGRVYWQHIDETDKGEMGDEFQESLTLTYLLNDKAQIAIWARRTDRQSDLELREYRRNEIGVRWAYKF